MRLHLEIKQKICDFSFFSMSQKITFFNMSISKRKVQRLVTYLNEMTYLESISLKLKERIWKLITGTTTLFSILPQEMLVTFSLCQQNLKFCQNQQLDQGGMIPPVSLIYKFKIKSQLIQCIPQTNDIAWQKRVGIILCCF